MGQSLRFAGREWRIVGIFDAAHTAFDSEIWGDVDVMMQAFRRSAYSVVLWRLADPDGFARQQTVIAADPRLTVEAKPEVQFYEEQSQALATFIRILGTALSIIFSIGAVVGAMITMFAAVSQRTGEIGTLRALGFRRGAVLVAFLGESLLLALRLRRCRQAKNDSGGRSYAKELCGQLRTRALHGFFPPSGNGPWAAGFGRCYPLTKNRPVPRSEWDRTRPWMHRDCSQRRRFR